MQRTGLYNTVVRKLWLMSYMWLFGPLSVALSQNTMAWASLFWRSGIRSLSLKKFGSQKKFQSSCWYLALLTNEFADQCTSSFSKWLFHLLPTKNKMSMVLQGTWTSNGPFLKFHVDKNKSIFFIYANKSTVIKISLFNEYNSDDFPVLRWIGSAALHAWSQMQKVRWWCDSPYS